jgi:hypothetical protein
MATFNVTRGRGEVDSEQFHVAQLLNLSDRERHEFGFGGRQQSSADLSQRLKVEFNRGVLAVGVLRNPSSILSDKIEMEAVRSRTEKIRAADGAF